MIMITRKLNLKFLLFVAACLISTAASATNRFYIDDMVLTEADLEKTITIPVKASFDSPVSTWEIQLVFPEGMTPRSFKKGRDMNVTNYNEYSGDEETITATVVRNNDFTRFVGSTDWTTINDDDNDVFNTFKWFPGDYEEMLLIDVYVSYYVSGGEIHIESKTTCGYDTRFETNITPDPTVTGFLYESDVNGDGSVDVSDATELIYYLAKGEYSYGGSYWYFGEDETEPHLRGDVTRDGIIDLRDYAALIDYLLGFNWESGNPWMTGYECDEATHEAAVDVFIPVPSDAYFVVHPEATVISAQDRGKDITIPIMANFSDEVAMWDVQFVFPEGLTPVAASPGSDMTLHYEYDGQPCSDQAALFHNADYTRFIGSPMTIYGTYETEDGTYEPYGMVKWSGGEYSEMMLLTLHVAEDFTDGEIRIVAQATNSYDARSTTQLFIPDPKDPPFLQADINGDNLIDIDDVVCYLNAIISPSNDGHESDHDLTNDSQIDIMDVCKLLDYLILGEWYYGYCLSLDYEYPSYIMVDFPPVKPGDLDGDDTVSIDDVTILISLVLEGGGSAQFNESADLNGDHVVDIDDITAIINMILHQVP